MDQMIDFEKLERRLSDRKVGRKKRAATIAAVVRRCRDRIAAHQQAMEASTRAISALEAEIARAEEFGRKIEAGKRRSSADRSTLLAEPPLELFDAALDAGIVSPDTEAVSMAQVSARRRAGDNFVWSNPLRVVPADAGAPRGADPRLPRDLREHLRRALAIPGYAHVAYAVASQWMGNDVLDAAQRFAEERATPMLALHDEFVGDAIDRTAAMGKGAAWVEQAKKALKRED